MAKTATAKSASDEVTKKKKKAGGATIKVKTKVKKDKSDKSDKAGKSGKAEKAGKAHRRGSDTFEGLTRFVDHPLVADLLAAGAMAAVAAIAEHQLDKDHKVGSSKMVKSVGKAAATAMGRRLMSDLGAITTAATDAAKKS